MSNNQDPSRALPQPPKITRKVQLGPVQLIGVPLIMLLPLLALLGVFGASGGVARASSGDIVMEAHHPTRFRYKMIPPLEVSVRNTGSETIPALTVLFDTDYLSRFSEVQFTPQVTNITQTDYILELTDILPGETRMISAQVQAEHYGRHRGEITAVTESGSEALVTINTIVFP